MKVVLSLKLTLRYLGHQDTAITANAQVLRYTLNSMPLRLLLQQLLQSSCIHTMPLLSPRSLVFV